MIGFIIFLIWVLLVGFVWLFIAGATQKRTVPQPSEVSTQLANANIVETLEQPRMTSSPANSHWYRHTFERPRRKKGKRC